jgi:ribonuclease HI
MKQKHLKALNSIEKWLVSYGCLNEELKTNLMALRSGVESVIEVEAEKVVEALPIPQEIAEDPMAIALFSDGGCRGNPGPGAYAFLAQRHDGQVLSEGVEFEILTTNNKMELSGALRGLKDLLEILPSNGHDPLLTKIKVITDSKYLVDGMKSWVAGWKSRGWKKADNKSPENLELWQELDLVRNKFMIIEWIWVRGHSGHPQNEYCDRKANELMDKNS